MVNMATYTTQLHHFELDLSAACYPNSISGRLNDVVPVLKTSTGKQDRPLFLFLSTLPHCPAPCLLSRAPMLRGHWLCSTWAFHCVATPSTRHHSLPSQVGLAAP